MTQTTIPGVDVATSDSESLHPCSACRRELGANAVKCDTCFQFCTGYAVLCELVDECEPAVDDRQMTIFEVLT